MKKSSVHGLVHGRIEMQSSSPHVIVTGEGGGCVCEGGSGGGGAL